MSYGITFNGTHSYRDLGLIMLSIKRNILPEPKLVGEDSLCKDGEYDFSSSNPDGRVKYKSRLHEVEFAIKENNLIRLRERAREIARWLSCGEKELYFDDEPDLCWVAKVQNKLDLEGQIGSIKRFTVQFKCKPYAVQNQEFIDVPMLFNITGNKMVTILNKGTFVKPLIKISGSFNSISFYCNGKLISYEKSDSGVIEIDCDKMRAIKDGNINVNNNIVGEFIELAEGLNSIDIRGTNLNCTVEFVFKCLYL